MPSILECAKLALNVYEGIGSNVGTFRPLVVCSRSNHSGSSFFGRAYKAGEIGAIAFRGSMELRDWLEADVAIARRMLPTAQLGDAFSFFSSARAQLEREGCKRLLVVGHSLGGGLAAVVAARVTCFPVTGVTFNAPGLASLSRNYGEVEAMDTVAHAIGLVSGLAGRSRLAGRVVEQGFRAAVPIPEARSSLAIAKDNARNVYNVRSVLDPVSLQGQHIGEVFHIPDAGAHPMGPLLEALETDRIGRMVAIMQV